MISWSAFHATTVSTQDPPTEGNLVGLMFCPKQVLPHLEWLTPFLKHHTSHKQLRHANQVTALALEKLQQDAFVSTGGSVRQESYEEWQTDMGIKSPTFQYWNTETVLDWASGSYLNKIALWQKIFPVCWMSEVIGSTVLCSGSP
jgi:hypothetical protein